MFHNDQWRIQVVWETGIPVCVPKLRHPKNTLQASFFQLYFNKKYLKVTINDFTLHVIISKWLGIHKCIQKRKTKSQWGRNEKRNCQRKCFHSLNYVLDHASIHFFFYVNSLHCFLWFLLYYLMRHLKLVSAIFYQIFIFHQMIAL